MSRTLLDLQVGDVSWYHELCREKVRVARPEVQLGAVPSAPVAMFVNSREIRAADFPLAEVRPLHLDAVARGDRRTLGVVVRKLLGVGNSTFVLSVENDNDFRSRCE